jgi:S1-C subfamily serine protease
MMLQGRHLIPTIKINHASRIGTAVLLRSQGYGYIVTARHLVEGLRAAERILVRRGDGWRPVEVQDVRYGDDNRIDDIAVLSVPEVAHAQAVDDDLVMMALTVGQAVAYCGFPLSLEGVAPDGHDWPMALVKGGIYSGSVRMQERMVHLFDAVNNVGFSGGPIFAQDVDGTPKLVAIVSGYEFDRDLEVTRLVPGGEREKVPDLFVRPNSGFMRAVPIRRAQELIAQFEVQ